MEFRICVILSIALVSLAHNAICLPRDVAVVKSESVTDIHNSLTAQGKLDHQAIATEFYIPGRTWCQNDGSEPNEDVICEKHCIPKGYSYGFCISNMCSCI
ncbi:unnamed protein product [Diatraea saccharalis]|uniref:Defensin n=1 Tax=Diatraea saccharalis TaxID=40085 RepID=A0A9N9W8Y4_9NEOP|nr:unnamed protein product [Diatraea saccharalis]